MADQQRKHPSPGDSTRNVEPDRDGLDPQTGEHRESGNANTAAPGAQGTGSQSTSTPVSEQRAARLREDGGGVDANPPTAQRRRLLTVVLVLSGLGLLVILLIAGAL